MGKFGGKQPHNTELPGYMLQIFVHRSIVEQYAYPSHAMGVPIPGTMTEYVFGSKVADGQARVLFHPKIFLDANNARLFHYCASPLQSCLNASVPNSRGAFLQELRTVLKPVLNSISPEQLIKRLQLD